MTSGNRAGNSVFVEFSLELCREKIGKAKALLELSLASAIKDDINKYFLNTFINTSTAKEGLRRISTPYWM